EQTRFAEEHAGDDLQTTITWCSARAEALAQLSDAEQASAFARRAVALADPTDALADKAEASMALARVMFACGAEHAARAAARDARAWYEAKGHTVGAERTRRWAGGIGQDTAEVAAASARQPTREPGARRPATLGE